MDRPRKIQRRLIYMALALLAVHNSNQCYSLNKTIVKEIVRSNKPLIISSIMAVGAVAIYAIRQYQKSQRVKNSAAPTIRNSGTPSIVIKSDEDDQASPIPTDDPYIPTPIKAPNTPNSTDNRSFCMAIIIDNFNTAINNFNETLRFKMLHQDKNSSKLWQHKDEHEHTQAECTPLADIPDNQWHTILQAHERIQRHCWRYDYLLEDLYHDPGRVTAINTLLKHYGERIQEMLPTLVQQAHGMNPDTIVSAQKRIITQYESLFKTLCQTSILTDETKGKVSQILNGLKALPTH